MSITFEKTTKNILNFYNNFTNYTSTKLSGLIYFDTYKKVYYQNNDIYLNIKKISNKKVLFFTISETFVNRPDKISKAVYGQDNLWWVILQHNGIVDPFELELGRVLEIPTLSNVYAKIREKRNRIGYQ